MEHAPVVDTPPSGHIRGKLKRQRSILDAARDIIVTSGEAGLTMRAMAAQAGVSPATPYNLFGSKQAVLQAIYQEDVQGFYTRFAERASDQPLARLFDLIDLSIDHWQGSPDYHKALLAILYRSAGPQQAESGNRMLRLDYVSDLIADAVAADDLRATTPVGVVTSMLARIFRAVALEWIDGALTLDQARKDLGQSFGLVLAGLVTPQSQAALADLQRRYAADAGHA